MSFGGDKKLSISTNSKEISRNTTQKDERTLKRRIHQLFESINLSDTDSEDETTKPTVEFPNVHVHPMDQVTIETEAPKTFMEFEKEHMDRMKLDVLLRDSDFTHIIHCNCLNGAFGNSKNHLLTKIGTTLQELNSSSQSILLSKDENGKELITITAEFFNGFIDSNEEKDECLPCPIPSCHHDRHNKKPISGTEETKEIVKNPRVRIADGKLFYKNTWYRTGQHIVVEGEFLLKFSAVICAIGKNCIGVLKFTDNGKFRIHIDHLIYGEMTIAIRPFIKI